MQATSPALVVLRRILADPAASGLVQLRPKSLDSAFDGNDYDFLSNLETHAGLLARLQAIAKEEGVSFLFDEAHSSKTHVQLWEPRRGVAIEIDFWKEHVLRAASPGPARYVRHDDVAAVLVRGEDGEARAQLPAEVEWLLYVIHLDTGNKDLTAPSVRERLGHYREALSDSPQTRLLEQLAELESSSADLSRLAAEALSLLEKTGVRIRPRALEDDLGVRVGNAIRRRVHARLHHPVVAFVGPDGSGKTTIIDALRREEDATGELCIFKHFFRMTRPYAFVSTRAPAYRRLDDNLADEKWSGLWFWVAWLQYPREMKLGRRRGRVFLDRYFHDLLIQDVRREGGAARLGFWRRRWARLFPLPDAIVQLSAPEKTLRARKEEISVENIRRYESFVERIYALRRPRLRAFLSTQDSVADCVAFLKIVLCRVGSGEPGGRS